MSYVHSPLGYCGEVSCRKCNSASARMKKKSRGTEWRRYTPSTFYGTIVVGLPADNVSQDIISGDELFSDAFPMKLVDDIAYEVDCAMITVKKGADVDIGANPSAEDAGEELEDGSQTVNNVVYSFQLGSTNFDKKSYLTYLKGKFPRFSVRFSLLKDGMSSKLTRNWFVGYMKAVKAKLVETGKDSEEIAAFEKGASAFAKKIVAKFKDYEFLIGPSMNPEGMSVAPFPNLCFP